MYPYLDVIGQITPETEAPVVPYRHHQRTPDIRSACGCFLGGLFGVETTEVFKDAHKPWYRRLARPVPLQLTIHLYSADEFHSRLFHAAQCRLVRRGRGAAHRVDRHIDLVA